MNEVSLNKVSRWSFETVQIFILMYYGAKRNSLACNYRIRSLLRSIRCTREGRRTPADSPSLTLLRICLKKEQPGNHAQIKCFSTLFRLHWTSTVAIDSKYYRTTSVISKQNTAYTFLCVGTEQCQVGVLPVDLLGFSKSCHFNSLDSHLSWLICRLQLGQIKEFPQWKRPERQMMFSRAVIGRSHANSVIH